MKCAYFVFLLLIGISCQIGSGHCAPDGILYDQNPTSMMGDISNKLFNTLKGVTKYTKEMFDSSIAAMTPSNPPSVTETVKHELSDMKESIGNFGNKVGGMVSNVIKETNEHLPNA